MINPTEALECLLIFLGLDGAEVRAGRLEPGKDGRTYLLVELSSVKPLSRKPLPEQSYGYPVIYQYPKADLTDRDELQQ